jgi:hypothetical protein
VLLDWLVGVVGLVYVLFVDYFFLFCFLFFVRVVYFCLNISTVL